MTIPTGSTWSKAAPGHKTIKHFITAPLGLATKPSEGAVCRMNRYWVVTPTNEILFYQTYDSPQCHSAEGTARALLKSSLFDHIPGCRVEFIPVVYVPRTI